MTLPEDMERDSGIAVKKRMHNDHVLEPCNSRGREKEGK